MVGPIARREAVGWLQTRGTSLRRACRVNLRAHRSKSGRGTPLTFTYKGIDLFTFDGLERLLDDRFPLFDFFTLRIKRKKGPNSLKIRQVQGVTSVVPLTR